MIAKLKNMDKATKVFLLFSIVSLLLLAVYIFYTSTYFFHSDMATRLLVASEQIRTHQLFPEGWHNTTGIVVGIWELLLIPFMLVINNWELCREFVVAIEIILCIITIGGIFKCVSKKDWLIPTCISVFLLCIPLGHFEEVVYEAAYVGIVTYFFAVFVACVQLMNKNIVSKRPYYVLLIVTVFLANYSGVRNYLMIVMPAFAMIVLYYWFEYKDHFIAEIRRDRLHYLLMVLMGISIVTLGAFMALKRIYPISSVAGNAFTDQIPSNIDVFIQSLLGFYRASGNCSIFSLTGVRIGINFIFMVMSAFVAPIYFVVKYKSIENRIIKLFTIYAWMSNFVVVFMMIFSTATTPRYYTTVYFNNIIFLALFIGHLWKLKRIDIKVVIVILLLGLITVNHVSYCKHVMPLARQKHIEQSQGDTLVDFLRNNDLKYGVATYWNAYNNMGRANGDIVIVSCLWNETTKEVFPHLKYFWGVSDYYFEPDHFPGRSFLLLGEGESVADSYYQLASEVKTYQNCKILIFDQNLYSYALTQQN